jgi:CelD/BcsL family acetyltransferase involved in cellulose biosynthesis
MSQQNQTSVSTKKRIFRRVVSIEAFESLQPAWDNLTRDPLRSFAWHFAWWNSFQHLGELCIFVLEAEGEVVGIAPFFQDRWNGQKRFRFLGSGKTCTDYAGLIVADGWRGRFGKAIANAISNSASMLEMEGVDGTVAQDALDQSLESRFWKYETELEPTWQLALPSDWESFIAGSKKSLKRKIKKAVKRQNSDEFEIRTTLDGLCFEEAWEHIVRLHQSRLVSKGKPGAFADENFREFLHNAVAVLAKEERAEIVVAYHEGEPFGAHLVLHDSGKTFLYLAGILAEKAKLEPGHFLITFLVRRAIEQGREVFDFLRGDQPYKKYWGAVPNQLQTIRFVSRSTVPTAINQGFRFLREVKHQINAAREQVRERNAAKAV